jgi:hypothetical protein
MPSVQIGFPFPLSVSSPLPMIVAPRSKTVLVPACTPGNAEGTAAKNIEAAPDPGESDAAGRLPLSEERNLTHCRSLPGQ